MTETKQVVEWIRILKAGKKVRLNRKPARFLVDYAQEFEGIKLTQTSDRRSRITLSY